METPFAIALPFTVHTYDVDFAGIVSNIVFVRWLEDLRLEMLKDVFPLEKAIAQGFFPVLLETRIEYRRAVKLFDRPVGRMWLKEAGKVRGTLEAEFVVGEIVAAHAEQVYCFVEVRTLRPLRHPPELLRYLRR